MLSQHPSQFPQHSSPTCRHQLWCMKAVPVSAQHHLGGGSGTLLSRVPWALCSAGFRWAPSPEPPISAPCLDWWLRKMPRPWHQPECHGQKPRDKCLPRSPIPSLLTHQKLLKKYRPPAYPKRPGYYFTFRRHVQLQNFVRAQGVSIKHYEWSHCYCYQSALLFLISLIDTVTNQSHRYYY